MVFDRAAILHQAHAAARKRIAPSHDHRFGDCWNSEAGGYVPHGVTYRQAFAAALRNAWLDAKTIAEEQAWAASQPAIPTDIAARAAALRTMAWYAPITAAGNASARALHAEADLIQEAALAAAALTHAGELHHAY